MPKEILCYGDSNTWGCIPRWKVVDDRPSQRYDTQTRWTSLLARELGSGYHIIEEGLGGRTSIYDRPGEAFLNGLPYFKPCLMTHRPLDLVVIMLGTNDIVQALQPTLDRLGDGIRTLIQVVQDTPKCGRDMVPPKILVVSPTHIKRGLGRTEVFDNYGGETGRDLSLHFAPVYEEIAREKGCWFLDAALYAYPSDADGLHWTPEGHAAFAPPLAAKIREIFQDT